jgi:hypothetical protein
LAAALLGAGQVLAVDLNPLCVKAAIRNVGLNGLEGFIKVIQGDAAAFLSGEADLILANVHCDLLIRLLELDDFSQKERLILSGLLRSQEPRASARGFFYRKSHSTWGLSALKPPWPFIPALPSGAFWLFHVKLVILRLSFQDTIWSPSECGNIKIVRIPCS